MKIGTMVALTELWPLSALVLETPMLELRVPREDDLVALAELAAEGVHDPATMPFSQPWTDVTPPERATSVLRWHWGTWSRWQPDDWSLDLVVRRDGRVVGTQGVMGRDFAIRREVETGSWLGREHQGTGTGTEMRAAVLHLAFAGLGAESARSAAFDDNPASLRVSRKLGYVDDGVERWARRGQTVTMRRLRLSRAAWAASSRVPVTIRCLEPSRSWFGLPEAGENGLTP